MEQTRFAQQPQASIRLRADQQDSPLIRSGFERCTEYIIQGGQIQAHTVTGCRGSKAKPLQQRISPNRPENDFKAFALAWFVRCGPLKWDNTAAAATIQRGYERKRGDGGSRGGQWLRHIQCKWGTSHTDCRAIDQPAHSQLIRAGRAYRDFGLPSPTGTNNRARDHLIIDQKLHRGPGCPRTIDCCNATAICILFGQHSPSQAGRNHRRSWCRQWDQRRGIRRT